MRLFSAFLLVPLAFGQVQRPPGFVRGVVTASTAVSFTVRTSLGATYEYRADAKTWIERDHERVRAASLETGEILEVVSDRDPEPVRYARMVHVIEPARARPMPVSAGGVYRLKPAAALLTGVYTGMVVSRERDHFTLRTRFDGDQTIYLHPDTEYLKDGDRVGSALLLPEIRISVVAIRDAGNSLVASQVIWGAILEPKR